MVSGFRQLVPDEGQPARAPTELQVAYDADALYVAARLARPQSRTHRPPAVAAGCRGRRRPVHPVPRSASRPADRRRPHGDRGRRPAGRRHLRRHLHGRHLGRGLGLRRFGRRAGLGGRDAHPVLPASLPVRGSADLGRERPPHRPADQRGLVAGPDAEQRERPRLAHGVARRSDRDSHAAPRRVAALRHLAGRVHRPQRPRGPVQRRVTPVRRRGARREGRSQEQPDAERDGQPGLRAGGSGPRRGQPVGVRDLLRGEAPVLHGRQPDLLAVRQGRPQRQLELLLPGAAAVLLAPHRPGSAGAGQRRLRRHAGVDDDSGRGQAHRADAAGMDRRPARGSDGARVFESGERAGGDIDRSRAPGQQLRGAGEPHGRVAGRDRGGWHDGAARSPGRRPCPIGS